MDEILASAEISPDRTVHVATLSRQTLVDSGAAHMGCEGYFLFEARDDVGAKGITVLGKAVSFDAAMRLVDIFFPTVVTSLA
jgi:hypothetical protein